MTLNKFHLPEAVQNMFFSQTLQPLPGVANTPNNKKTIPSAELTIIHNPAHGRSE